MWRNSMNIKTIICPKRSIKQRWFLFKEQASYFLGPSWRKGDSFFISLINYHQESKTEDSLFSCFVGRQNNNFCEAVHSVQDKRSRSVGNNLDSRALYYRSCATKLLQLVSSRRFKFWSDGSLGPSRFLKSHFRHFVNLNPTLVSSIYACIKTSENQKVQNNWEAKSVSAGHFWIFLLLQCLGFLQKRCISHFSGACHALGTFYACF